jgi:hypothetical protein
MILTRRRFLSAAATGVSSPIWATTITARVSDSQLFTDIEHRTFNFYWERTNHGNGIGCRPTARAAKPSRWAGHRRAALFSAIGMVITRAWRFICSRSAHGLTGLRMARSRHGLRPSQHIGGDLSALETVAGFQAKRSSISLSEI